MEIMNDYPVKEIISINNLTKYQYIITNTASTILLRPPKQKIHIFSIGINDKSIISSNVNQLIELLFKVSSSLPTSNIPERAVAPVRGKSQTFTLPVLLRRTMQIFHRFKDSVVCLQKSQYMFTSFLLTSSAFFEMHSSILVLTPSSFSSQICT